MRIITKNSLKRRHIVPTPQKPTKGLSSKRVNDYLRFSLFLVAIGMFYIHNSYEAEKKIKLVEAYQKQTKTLKSDYLLKQAKLSANTRFMMMKADIDTLGLRSLREPAFQIVKGLDVPFYQTLPQPQAPEVVPMQPTDDSLLNRTEIVMHDR
ncbi:MAG: FtsL-like putative cell division protein [Bacteroidota bacterium]